MVIQLSLSRITSPGRKVQSSSYLNFESDGIAFCRAAIDELLKNLIRVAARSRTRAPSTASALM